jgi:ABC-type sugar transport system ATPase subunit
VADRAVVLRQGKYVGEAPADAEHQEELVSMIVGSGEATDEPDEDAPREEDGAAAKKPAVGAESGSR